MQRRRPDPSRCSRGGCGCSNDRELFAGNCGGYDGAHTDDGDFMLLVENHAGQSGPRWELSEILEWCVGLRRMQRLLGYAEDELTYAYDFVAWCVDNCSGNRGSGGGAPGQPLPHQPQPLIVRPCAERSAGHA